MPLRTTEVFCLRFALFIYLGVLPVQVSSQFHSTSTWSERAVLLKPPGNDARGRAEGSS